MIAHHRLTLSTLALAAVFAITACSGASADNPPNDPDATFATVPDSLAESSTVAATSPESTATTIALVPSEGADLPTGSPEELATARPATTVAGPLPIPNIQLFDVAQFEAPVEVTSRDFDLRTFVVEQGGRVVAVDDLSNEVVLDITDLTSADGERGLLGAAFHPDQDFAYVHYSDADGNTVIAEFAIDPVTAVFDRASQREVLTAEQPFGNHNGGEIAFGPDGFLYIGLGDGGSAGDPERNALELSSPLGKILRIDPRADGDQPFIAPADNPFVGVDEADPTIWSLGLRNPWKFSFDTATGDLWIGDVGQGAFEEIDFAPAANGRGAGRGLSFGWSAFEGNNVFNDDQSPGDHTAPVLTYTHDDGNCSVSGGAVYRGASIPDLVGWYVYGDFCSGQIWGYDPTSGSTNPVIVELAELGNLSAIAVGADDELYAVSNAGTVSRFAPA